MPVVAKPMVGMPVRSSMTFATASKSKPVMAGMGVPARAMNLGESSPAAVTMSEISFSSSPRMASISLRAEMKTMLSMSYQRGSSWVV